MRKPLVLATLLLLALAAYVIAYLTLGERTSGRARGAGEYFHYRDFSHPWEVYLFVPAAFCEAQLILLDPKPFLPNPSWSDTPQRLFLRVPDNTTTFSFPSLTQRPIRTR